MRQYLKLSVLFVVFAFVASTPVEQMTGTDQLLETLAIKSYAADKSKPIGCLKCVPQIIKAVKHCIEAGNGQSIPKCVFNVIGSVHHCFKCICEILETFGIDCELGRKGIQPLRM